MDIYVSNAARHLHKTFFETTNEDWHCFLSQQLTEAFVPGMIAARWGRIIHINSPDGYTDYISRRNFFGGKQLRVI